MLGFEHRKKSKGNSRVQQPQANKKTFYDRWGWLVLIASLTCVPFAFFGAGKAIQSNVNKVEDWLPKSFPETKELAWFRANFPSDQFILVSWEGCKLGEDPALGADGDDPRIAKLAELVAPKVVDPNDLDASEAKKFFKSVSTGRMLLDQLTQGAMDYPAAVERLKGSVLGPDGRQTCVIVSLDPETTSKLKPILGRGQMRIFRPNIPPGVLRRLIARAGIEEDNEVKEEPGTEATRGASTYSWLKSPPTETDDGGSEPGLQHVKSEATQDDDEPAHESRKRVHWEDDSKSSLTIASSLGPVTTPAESDE